MSILENKIECIKPFENEKGLQNFRRSIKLKAIWISILICSMILLPISLYAITFIGAIDFRSTILSTIMISFILVVGFVYVVLHFEALFGHSISKVIEYIIRYFIGVKSENYQFLKLSAVKDLNQIVEENNGMLFRKYQYIEADMSSKNEIVVKLPLTARVIEDCNKRENEACIFEQLNEVEMSNILTPISEYHRQREINDKMKIDEELMLKQSKINAEITEDIIESKPLFKSLKKLECDIQKDIDTYYKQQKRNVAQYSKILKEAESNNSKSI